MLEETINILQYVEKTREIINATVQKINVLRNNHWLHFDNVHEKNKIKEVL